MKDHLLELSEVVPRAQSLEELVRPLLKMLEEATGLESTYLTKIDLHTGIQQVQFAHNSGTMTIPEGLSVPWEDTLCKRSLDAGLEYTDEVVERWGDSSAARLLGIQTYVSTPIRSQDGELLGTLCAASNRRQPLSNSASSTLRLFAGLMTHFVQREMLIEQLRVANDKLASSALTDPLTELPNRRAILDHLSRMLAQNGREGRQTLVGVIDMDGFKEINDSYGHQTGDTFLREIAQRINDSLRASDVLGRIGGDEFVVVGPGPHADNQDDPGGKNAASLLQQRIEKATIGSFDLASTYIEYTGASVGVVAVDSRVANADQSFELADEAMYRVKQRRKAGSNSNRSETM